MNNDEILIKIIKNKKLRNAVQYKKNINELTKNGIYVEERIYSSKIHNKNIEDLIIIETFIINARDKIIGKIIAENEYLKNKGFVWRYYIETINTPKKLIWTAFND